MYLNVLLRSKQFRFAKLRMAEWILIDLDVTNTTRVQKIYFNIAFVRFLTNGAFRLLLTRFEMYGIFTCVHFVIGYKSNRVIEQYKAARVQ